MASIKKINERKFKITISNGYRADGRKISKAKTITVPDTVPAQADRAVCESCGRRARTRVQNRVRGVRGDEL